MGRTNQNCSNCLVGHFLCQKKAVSTTKLKISEIDVTSFLVIMNFESCTISRVYITVYYNFFSGYLLDLDQEQPGSVWEAIFSLVPMILAGECATHIFSMLIQTHHFDNIGHKQITKMQFLLNIEFCSHSSTFWEKGKNRSLKITFIKISAICTLHFVCNGMRCQYYLSPI